MSTISNHKHALFVAAPGWGHIQPLISLVAKLIHERPEVIITFTLVGDFASRIETQINKYFDTTDREKTGLKENIRLLYFGGLVSVDLVQLVQAYFHGFAQAYPKLYAEEPVHCVTGRVLQPTKRPDVIVLDPFLYEAMKTIQKVSGNSIPVVAWNSAALTSMLRTSGPTSLGGLGNVPLRAEALAKETGNSSDDFLLELYQPETGEVVEVPGLPRMYDYEYNSQHMEPELLRFQRAAFPMAFWLFEECDGVLSVGNASVEPEACEAIRTWFAPRPVYFIGPLLPKKTSVTEEPPISQEEGPDGSPNEAQVQTFLDAIQQTHGDHSLLYISFGSYFWPLGDGIWKVLEVVLDMKIPLILSHNPRIVLPSHIQEKLYASEVVLVSSWAPQYRILGHCATGWFLTHCGNNSVTEAISNGVPMIAWPLTGDQPATAALISSTLNVGYELFETRLGPGLKPLRRGVKPEGTLQAIEKETKSVLSNAWGSDGEQKRENVQALKKKVSVAWDEDGEARKELRQFLNKYLPVN